MSIRYRIALGVLGILAVGLSWVIGETPPGVSGGENILLNPGFEQRTGDLPLGWSPVALPGGTGDIEFSRESEVVHSGMRSVRISASGSRRGLWQQIVPVRGGTVYSLTAYVACEAIAPGEGDCHLQVVFRDAENRVVQFVDYPGHDGTRGFEFDYPAQLKFRAPHGAVRAEINAYLKGPGTAWFDDLVFAEAPTGRIAGRVASGGEPVEGATVWIHGDPWGRTYEASSGRDGSYELLDVPVAFPRYIVLVRKDGFRTFPQGDIAVTEGETTAVDFAIEPGQDPLDDLEVRYGFLALAHPQRPTECPENAIIPADEVGYPASVREYLKPDEYITSDDPGIRALAAELLESISQHERSNTRVVAWAVYEWVSRNRNHDAVFGNGRDPYRDVTSGIWQTIQDGGWCWGRSFYDWAYNAAESLQQGSFICVEHSWLCCALLRALNIPARARVGSAQFWVQTPPHDGYWVGMSTNGGSNTYREHGTLGAGFGGSTSPAYVSATSEPFLHEDWNLANPGLWHETHPWGESYEGTDAGLQRATTDLAAFAQTGEAPRGAARRVPGAATYEVNYSAITLNLYSVGDQRTLDVRFPIVTESELYNDTGEREYWTNHPECVVRTWVEEIVNPPVEGVQRWFHIEFDLTSLMPQ